MGKEFEREELYDAFVQSVDQPFHQRFRELFSCLDVDGNGDGYLSTDECLLLIQLLYWQELCVFVMGTMCISSELPFVQFAARITRQIITDYFGSNGQITRDQILFWLINRGDSIFDETFYHLPSATISTVFQLPSSEQGELIRVPNSLLISKEAFFTTSVEDGMNREENERTEIIKEEFVDGNGNGNENDGEREGEHEHTQSELSPTNPDHKPNDIKEEVNANVENGIDGMTIETIGVLTTPCVETPFSVGSSSISSSPLQSSEDEQEQEQEQEQEHKEEEENEETVTSYRKEMVYCLRYLYQSLRNHWKSNISLRSILEKEEMTGATVLWSVVETHLQQLVKIKDEEQDEEEEEEVIGWIQVFGKVLRMIVQPDQKNQVEVLSLRILFTLLDGLLESDVDTQVQSLLLVLRDPAIPNFIPKATLIILTNLLIRLLVPVPLLQSNHHEVIFSLNAQSFAGPIHENAVNCLLGSLLAFASPRRIESPFIHNVIEQTYATGSNELEKKKMDDYEGILTELANVVLHLFFRTISQTTPANLIFTQLFYLLMDPHPDHHFPLVDTSSTSSLDVFMEYLHKEFSLEEEEEEEEGRNYVLTPKDVAVLTGSKVGTTRLLLRRSTTNRCFNSSSLQLSQSIVEIGLSPSQELEESHVDIFSRDSALGIIIRVGYG